MPSTFGFCLFGAGRIGSIHARNVAGHPRARLEAVVDTNLAAAEATAAENGARAWTSPIDALSTPGVDAVIIASPTRTHVPLIQLAAEHGKAILCEKPIDLDLERVDACVAELSERGVPFLVGFNRRFDPSFRALHDALSAGRIGQVETVAITSRDPRPPAPEYVNGSGGIFRDMTIHDLDMARWLLGEDPIEIYAVASCLVDPAIGAAGDADTAVLTLRTASGALACIQNSRRAVYGYDQRVEVHGSLGMLRAENVAETTLSTWGADAVASSKPKDFFLERYAEAYRAELDHFVACLSSGAPASPGAHDGRQALALAEAAAESARTNRPVRCSPSPRRGATQSTRQSTM